MKEEKIIKKFLSKSGKEIVIRYPQETDLDEFLVYINKLSKEDTYITFSGEEISKKDEKDFLKETLKKIKEKNGLLFCAFYGSKLVGISDVTRQTQGRKRTKHVGLVGLSVDKSFRTDGIGKELLLKIIKYAKSELDLNLLILHVYEPNTKAKDLYYKLGFREYGRLPGGVKYHGKFVDEMSMYLEI